jgi:CRP-like cAMP-binding protein
MLPTRAELRQVVGLRQAADSDLDQLLAHAVTRAVEESSYIFMQGDPADRAYVLTSGQAKLLQSSNRGQQVHLRTIYPWQMFGALGVVRPSATYPVSAQAMSDCTALAIEAAFFRDLAKTRPHLAMDILELMATTFRRCRAATGAVHRRVGSEWRTPTRRLRSLASPRSILAAWTWHFPVRILLR